MICVRSKMHIRILWKHYPQTSLIITGTEVNVLIQPDEWLTLAWQWMAEACVHIWFMMNRSKKQAGSVMVWEWQSSLSSHQTMAELNTSMPSVCFIAHCNETLMTNSTVQGLNYVKIQNPAQRQQHSLAGMTFSEDWFRSAASVIPELTS